MAQIVEAKLRKSSKSDKHFEWAKSQLDANKEEYTKKKLDVIRELAYRLEEEGEIGTDRISTEITRRLGKRWNVLSRISFEQQQLMRR
jgi:hypothetical protein